MVKQPRLNFLIKNRAYEPAPGRRQPSAMRSSFPEENAPLWRFVFQDFRAGFSTGQHLPAGRRCSVATTSSGLFPRSFL